jgi:hypothetical protein
VCRVGRPHPRTRGTQLGYLPDRELEHASFLVEGRVFDSWRDEFSKRRTLQLLRSRTKVGGEAGQELGLTRMTSAGNEVLARRNLPWVTSQLIQNIGNRRDSELRLCYRCVYRADLFPGDRRGRSRYSFNRCFGLSAMVNSSMSERVRARSR